MGEERLVERLRSWEREPLRRERADQGRVVDSILAHLRCILNTRQGGVPIAADYGVPDFLDFLQTYPESVREIEHSIWRVIELYEPRLERVQVSFIPWEDDLLVLRFQILGQLRGGSGAQLRFETTVDTDGKVCVRR
jgi:type VI secretion system protein